jgi:hypothetical protein
MRIRIHADPDPQHWLSVNNRKHGTSCKKTKKGLKTAFHREQQNTNFIPPKQKKEAYRTHQLE